MLQHHIRYFVMMLIFAPNALQNSSFSDSNLPPWTWECENERCIPSRSSTADKLQSLATCNMLCGNMQLWPQPTGAVALSTTGIPVRADLFQIVSIVAPSQIVHDYIQTAFHLFKENIIQLESKTHGFAEWRAVALRIIIEGSKDPSLKIDTDESYALHLEPKYGADGPLEALINAKSFCGARHGLETLSQLVWLDPYFASLFIVETATIIDEPKFKYRGIMLDTARNFFPLNDLFRTIDAMSASKLNTFHWRISDSQSFAMKIKAYPQLTTHGAYGPKASYSPEEVRKVVEFARVRGIRVLIEVDTPAHVGGAWSWGPSMGLKPLVLCLYKNPWDKDCKEPPCGQLNPKNPYVYKIMEAVYSEIISLTGVDDIFHLGGDDVSEHCWQDYFETADPRELWVEHTKKALRVLESVNGKLPNMTILWSSPVSQHFRTDLSNYQANLGLQVRNSEDLESNTKGVRTIVSHEKYWDFNSGTDAWYSESGGTPYNSWQSVYEHRPWNYEGDVMLVEGGEATVWSMGLGSGGLDARIWPRGAALAERLWSDRAEGATRIVQIRLDVHRIRLLSRGIRVSPLWSMWCTQNPYTCG